jgi:molybdate-binding protein
MKQEVKNTIENFIIIAQESYPSIYSKDDVVKLLRDMLAKVEEIEETEVEVKEGTYTKEQIANAIADMRTDTMVDIRYDSAEFELCYNEISVTEIDYNVDTEEIEKSLFKALDNQ